MEAYDYVIIDSPPSLGLLTLNALTAAERVLVPLQCEYYALEGLTHLMATIDRVKRRAQPGPRVEGIVLTMFDARNKLTHQVADEVKRHFHVFDSVIPRNVRLSEAPSHGKPALLYDVQSKGAQGYLSLAREILEAGVTADPKRPPRRSRPRPRAGARRAPAGPHGGGVERGPATAKAASSPVPIEKIVPQKGQPRQHFDAAGLEELAASIREHGLIEPLVVRRVAAGRRPVRAHRRRAAVARGAARRAQGRARRRQGRLAEGGVRARARRERPARRT